MFNRKSSLVYTVEHSNYLREGGSGWHDSLLGGAESYIGGLTIGYTEDVLFSQIVQREKYIMKIITKEA